MARCSFAHHLLPIILLVALLTSCATSRQYHAVTSVSDTTHIVAHDTLRVTQVRDSVIVRVRELTHEQEITLFDPTTGHPVQRQVTRDIERDIDSIVQHMVDSIFQAHQSEQSGAHEVTNEVHHQQHMGQASLSPVQLFARKAATIICLLFSIAFIVVVVRIYRQPKS